MPRTTLIRSIKPEGQYHAIRFTINGKSMTAAWIDTPTTKDFISLLAMTLELDDYASTEKIAYLPQILSTKGARARVDHDVGDIAKSATKALIKDNLLRLTVFGPSELVTPSYQPSTRLFSWSSFQASAKHVTPPFNHTEATGGSGRQPDKSHS